jgi:8-oxo-dGTP pyrophosphatase MutT (NUDIX family)
MKRRRVRVMVVDDADRLFLLQARDRKAPHQPAWQLPGGRVKPGEEPREAALRELAEETGYTPDMMAGPVVGPLWYAHSRRRGRRRVDEVYVAYLKRGQTPAPTALSRAEERTMTDARWWTHGELQSTPERLRLRTLPRIFGEFIEQGEPVRPVRVVE